MEGGILAHNTPAVFPFPYQYFIVGYSCVLGHGTNTLLILDNSEIIG